MLKRQEIGEKMFPPAEVETVIRMLTAAHPDGTGQHLGSAAGCAENRVSLDRRLEESGPLTPERFSLLEANERLAKLLAVPEVRMKLRIEVGERRRRATAM